MAKFQEFVLDPQGARGEVALREAKDGEGLVHLQGRLVTAAAEIKATTMSSRVPEEIQKVQREFARRKGDQPTSGHEALGQWPCQ